jgi:hypothetical protein
LFLFAKHKFVAARRHIVFARHFSATTLLPLRMILFTHPLPPQGYPLQQNQCMVRTAVRETKNVAQVKSRAVHRHYQPLMMLGLFLGCSTAKAITVVIPSGPDGTHR